MSYGASPAGPGNMKSFLLDCQLFEHQNLNCQNFSNPIESYLVFSSRLTWTEPITIIIIAPYHMVDKLT